MLGTPTNGTLVSTVASPAAITFSFDGVAGADHYDVYRSTDPKLLGDKLNSSGIAQPGASPWTFQYTDNGAGLLAAPLSATRYYYRAVAMDASGNPGLVSDALAAAIGTSKFVRSDLRQNIIAFLKADAELVSLVGANAEGPVIIGEHKYSEMLDDLPYLVVTDGEFRENNRFTVPCKRYGVQPVVFEAYDATASSQAVEDILNRVSALLRDAPGGKGGRKSVGSANVRVFFGLPLNGYQEFYDEAVRLHGKRLVVEFTVELVET